MSTPPKKNKKLQRISKEADKSPSRLGNLKAIPKNFLKSSYNKLDPLPPLPPNAIPQASKLRASGVRGSFISGPSSNPSLSRVAGSSISTRRPSSLRFQSNPSAKATGLGLKSTTQSNITSQSRLLPHQHLDTAPFFEQKFDPNQYLEATLEGEQWKDIKSYYIKLQEASEQSSSDLQTHVYRNYPEFVTIAKEIAQLETDLFELKDVLNELHSAVETFSSDVTCGDSSTKNGENQTSHSENSETLKPEESSLDSTNRKELTKLWNIVQGSMEHLPYVEDRRPLLESPGWKELDQATFRVKRDAHFFLLTDSLLVATRVKRQTIIDIKHTRGSKQGLTARSCFKLTDMGFADVKDTPESRNAFKIINKNEIYVFSARDKNEKQKLLRAIARATTDHFRQVKQRALLETTKKVGQSLDASESRSRHSIIKPAVKEGVVTAPTLTNDFWDGLEICIAHHQYKDAIDFVVEAQSTWAEYVKNTKAQEVVESPHHFELNKKIHTLATLLEKRILESVTKAALKTYILQLIRLGLTGQAQRAFLAARHRQMRRRTRQLDLDGNTERFVASLSQAVFGMLAHSCRWYAEMFPARSGTSQLVAWVLEEVESFGHAYRRQVHCQPPRPQSTLDICLSTASRHAHQLNAVGLDLNFMLDRILAPV